MEDYPRTILEFEKQFATEKACHEYFAGLRWPNGFNCPRCNHHKAWRMNRGLYRCCQCDYQVSVTAGTIFQDTRNPLMLWFRAIWYVVNQKNGVSALGLQRVLGLPNYRTVWTWLHKLRLAMVRPGRDKLSGLVEVDETYIGGTKPGKRGRGAAGKTLVLVAVEDKGKSFGRIRLHRIADASENSLIPAVQESIEPNSAVRTDGWKGYKNLSSKGYQHSIVRQSADIGDNLLPLSSQVTGLLKKWLLGTHQGGTQPSHLDYYLDEFTFRFNRRTSRFRGKLFYRLLQQATLIQPVTRQEIRGGR